LIIPDISPTSKDLDDAMTDGDLGTTDTDVNKLPLSPQTLSTWV
jgi:hypothetical protein